MIIGSGSENSGHLPFPQLNFPESTIRPPIEFPWPPTNFVAKWTTTSIPCYIGLTNPTAEVLSTTKAIPAS